MTSNYIKKEFQEDVLEYISFDRLIEMKITQSDNDSLIKLEEILHSHRKQTVYRILVNRFPILEKAKEGINLTFILSLYKDNVKKVKKLKYVKLGYFPESYLGEKISMMFQCENKYTCGSSFNSSYYLYFSTDSNSAGKLEFFVKSREETYVESYTCDNMIISIEESE